MIESGILAEGEPFELLDGYLVRKDRSAAGADPMTIGHEHAWVVGELVDLNPKLRRLGCHIRIQQPVALPPYDEPEPDAAIVIGTNKAFLKRHPGAGDVACVVEVADASLHRDRVSKLRVYAASAIPTYVIVNLPDRVIEIYSEPIRGKGSYRHSVSLTRADRLELPAGRGKKLVVPVNQLLPR
jgi:hypothetical protein